MYAGMRRPGPGRGSRRVSAPGFARSDALTDRIAPMMSWVTVVWSVNAGICLTLAGMQLLVDGNPLENLDLVADPDKNFVVVMKDGVIYKNTVK